jgi:hypothetical protein
MTPYEDSNQQLTLRHAGDPTLTAKGKVARRRDSVPAQMKKAR